MPPKATGAPAKRKAPTFKPPRPAAKVPKTSTRAAPQPRRKSAPATVTTLSSSNDDDDDDDDGSPAMEGEEDIEPQSQRIEPPPTIPTNLLTKLLHHHFADPGTRIGKDANVLLGKYVETFVREAIARAAFERQEDADNGGAGGDFLEVRALLVCSIDRKVALVFLQVDKNS